MNKETVLPIEPNADFPVNRRRHLSESPTYNIAVSAQRTASLFLKNVHALYLSVS